MNIYLTTLGCRLNEAETEQWAPAFATAGHHVVGSPQQAQVMVLNTCAVTTEAARKSRQFVNRLHRQNPSARLVVTGCYAELKPAGDTSLMGVDLVIGNKDKDRLADLVAEQLDVYAMPAMAIAADGAHVYRAARTRAFVKVQDGCRNHCTFCIVTVARGDERSRGVAEVVAEINQLHAVGYQEAGAHGGAPGGLRLRPRS